MMGKSIRHPVSKSPPERRHAAMAACGHGGVAVIAWLSDSTVAGGGQAGSQTHVYAADFSTISLWPDYVNSLSTFLLQKAYLTSQV